MVICPAVRGGRTKVVGWSEVELGRVEWSEME